MIIIKSTFIYFRFIYLKTQILFCFRGLVPLCNLLLDLTLGAGGHTKRLLEESAPNGKVLGIDRDKQVIDYCQKQLEYGLGYGLFVLKEVPSIHWCCN